jgi:hypothetical protein
MECFGAEIAGDKIERNHRFIEEALELVQACGATASECHQLVDYVFGRPVGEPFQESGGVMVTHAALCLANGLNMHDNGEVELTRIWTKVEKIRAKQAAKPKHSPLPQAPEREAVTPAMAKAILIGGNHLASAIMAVRDPATLTTYDEALAKVGQPFADLWVAWRAIMDAREALSGIKEQGRGG